MKWNEGEREKKATRNKRPTADGYERRNPMFENRFLR